MFQIFPNGCVIPRRCKSFCVGVAAYMLAAVLLTLPANSQDRPRDIEALRNTEREFSANSEKQGMFQAFVAFFAEGGFHFSPMPAAVKDDFVREVKEPIEFTLAWRPALNDVAQAGDLGYSSGPWTITDKTAKSRPSAYGTFLSIWRKQKDGSWRVIVDAGVRVKTPTVEHSGDGWTAGKQPVVAVKNADRYQENWDLVKRDRDFSTAATSGLATSYGQYAFIDARLLRNDLGPVSAPEGKKTLLQDAEASGRHAWLPLQAEVSASGDLGYTWGSYMVTPMDSSKPVTKGFYVRVWRRDSDRSWKVVAEVFRPLPEPPPPQQ